MSKIVEIRVLPKFIKDESEIRKLAAKAIGIKPLKIKYVELLRKSVDARKSQAVFQLRVEVFIEDEPNTETFKYFSSNLKARHKKVLIVGAGPAGYFAALQCIALGISPIIIDRGKPVQERRRDLRAIQQEGIVNPDSNYCFGEGGAGTYSDGKLYTRSHKRGNIEEILQILHEYGAKRDILFDAHPHIGSNKLPKIISAIREAIEKHGGEVRFNTKLTDFVMQDQKIVGLEVSSGAMISADAYILATGHSARDIYKLLHEKNIKIEAKPFAMGVRVEHPQALIDEIQYNQNPRESNLPASSYKLACQINNAGVFSFCMCPGGLIVPAATSPGELVVNGMSLSRRDSPYANSGVVTEVNDQTLGHLGYKGLFAGLNFQKSVEQSLFNHGEGGQQAPAQRLTDFVNETLSSGALSSSYIPGVYSTNLHEVLPNIITSQIQKGVIEFDRKMKGYYTSEALVIGCESRTSAPIRIPRNRETAMHDDVEGLFPCGEGAGYAGGILSAAMDGMNVAKSVYKYLC